MHCSQMYLYEFQYDAAAIICLKIKWHFLWKALTHKPCDSIGMIFETLRLSEYFQLIMEYQYNIRYPIAPYNAGLLSASQDRDEKQPNQSF